ncbi:hypothetical protein [Bifidobacterium sp. SO1]|uniref:hypothetical protein n=1 Tax=Bifidobacterium sp. SO1 TaxID=2809029 RepID=UPI001BDCED5E|nr:hypothetical protein [Bifidobacterium sp. SO1]MBT1160919.1 hypothetical protein [Bifidobacterium sp. SO1]
MTSQDTEIRLIGRLTHDVTFRTVDDNNRIAYLDLQVELPPEDTMIVHAQARGPVAEYLHAHDCRQGDHMIVFGTLKTTRKGDEYVAVRIAAAGTSKDWRP